MDNDLSNYAMEQAQAGQPGPAEQRVPLQQTLDDWQRNELLRQGREAARTRGFGWDPSERGTYSNPFGRNPDDFVGLLERLKLGTPDIYGKPPGGDPRVQALQQYMEMQGSGPVPTASDSVSKEEQYLMRAGMGRQMYENR
jgi:hypothetical protein